VSVLAGIEDFGDGIIVAPNIVIVADMDGSGSRPELQEIRKMRKKT
jgi:hypothetical protein